MPAPFEPPWIPFRTLPANPAAGQPYTFTVPVGQFVHLTSLTFDVFPSNQVGNRFVEVFFHPPGGQHLVTMPFLQTLVANQNFSFSAFINADSQIATSQALENQPLPDILQTEGDFLTIFVLGMQTNDTIQNIVISGEYLPYA